MSRILCLFGFHEWENQQMIGTGWHVRYCNRCGFYRTIR